MTNEEILKKAMNKAGKNGYRFGKDWTEATAKAAITMNLGTEYIFSHDFAKAFWGEETKSFRAGSANLGLPFCNDCGNKNRHIEIQTNCWKYHLQQMVLEKNPIKYLEQFLAQEEGKL